MKNWFIPKGSYGYIKNHRVVAALRTLLFFGVSIGLYVRSEEHTSELQSQR